MTDSERDVTAVTTSAERAAAGGHWLLASSPQGRAEWAESGVAWLRPGFLFGAIVVPAPIVHAALALDDPAACAGPLAEGLEQGPVFYSWGAFGRDGAYTALVSASVAMGWREDGAVAHHYGALLAVPAPDVVEPREREPWWVVPMDGPGLLCPADRLAALVSLGREVSRRNGGRPGGGGRA